MVGGGRTRDLTRTFNDPRRTFRGRAAYHLRSAPDRRRPSMTEPAQTTLAAPRMALGAHAPAYAAAAERARVEDWAGRLFARDVTLWTSDARVGATIAERLGWLDAPGHFADRTAALEGFGDAVVDEG